jgi:hypothetical protein
MKRSKTTLTMLVGALGLALSACAVDPGPVYQPAPMGYYAPAPYGYYAPYAYAPSPYGYYAPAPQSSFSLFFGTSRDHYRPRSRHHRRWG